MKKLLLMVAMATTLVSCQSKGNKVAEEAEYVVDSLESFQLSDSMVSKTYQGVLPAADCQGIRYMLTIKSLPHSGDGIYELSETYIGGDNGKDKTITSTGKRFTLRGTPSDNNATVYQLVSDDNKRIINFLAEGDSALTMLNDEFKKAMSELNYTINIVE